MLSDFDLPGYGIRTLLTTGGNSPVFLIQQETSSFLLNQKIIPTADFALTGNGDGVIESVCAEAQLLSYLRRFCGMISNYILNCRIISAMMIKKE